MPKFIVEALSQYRMVYYIESETQEQAELAVNNGDVGDEFGQQHLGEFVISSREVDNKEVIRLFDELNYYLADRRSEEEKYNNYYVVSSQDQKEV